jgi:hypothetical protein
VTIKACDEEGVEEKTRKGTFEEQVGGTAEGSDRESDDEKGGDSQRNKKGQEGKMSGGLENVNNWRRKR